MGRTPRVVRFDALCIGVLLCALVVPSAASAQRAMDLGQVDLRGARHPRPNAFYILTRRPPPAPDPASLPPALRQCAADIEAAQRRLRELSRRRSRVRGEVTNADFEAEEAIERAALTRCLGHLRSAPPLSDPRPIAVEFFHAELEFQDAIHRYVDTMDAAAERDEYLSVDVPELDASTALYTRLSTRTDLTPQERAEALYQLGYETHESGDGEAARPILEQALSIEPRRDRHGELAFRVAELHYDHRNNSEAARFYRIAVDAPESPERTPHRALALYKLAWAEFQTGNWLLSLRAIARLSWGPLDETIDQDLIDLATINLVELGADPVLVLHLLGHRPERSIVVLQHVATAATERGRWRLAVRALRGVDLERATFLEANMAADPEARARAWVTNLLSRCDEYVYPQAVVRGRVGRTASSRIGEALNRCLATAVPTVPSPDQPARPYVVQVR